MLVFVVLGSQIWSVVGLYNDLDKNSFPVFSLVIYSFGLYVSCDGC